MDKTERSDKVVMKGATGRQRGGWWTVGVERNRDDAKRWMVAVDL